MGKPSAASTSTTTPSFAQMECSSGLVAREFAELNAQRLAARARRSSSLLPCAVPGGGPSCRDRCGGDFGDDCIGSSAWIGCCNNRPPDDQIVGTRGDGERGSDH